MCDGLSFCFASFIMGRFLRERNPCICENGKESTMHVMLDGPLQIPILILHPGWQPSQLVDSGRRRLKLSSQDGGQVRLVLCHGQAVPRGGHSRQTRAWIHGSHPGAHLWGVRLRASKTARWVGSLGEKGWGLGEEGGWNKAKSARLWIAASGVNDGSCRPLRPKRRE